MPPVGSIGRNDGDDDYLPPHPHVQKFDLRRETDLAESVDAGGLRQLIGTLLLLAHYGSLSSKLT